MALGDAHAPGATPLDPDEADGLIPKHITTQAQLNEWEQNNILEAQMWAFSNRRPQILTGQYARALHRKMFGDTWRWAGTFRTTEKTIGVDPGQISIQLRDLLENTKAQRDHAAYPLDEIAARLHHRLVSIHPFSNGNGRHARLFTDVFLKRHDAPVFSWGGRNLADATGTRSDYIAALRAADMRDMQPLLAFVRS